MSPTSFSELVDLCKNLEITTKRKEKTRLISEFLRQIDTKEVEPAVLLIVGSIFPEGDPRTLEVGWRTIKKVLEGRKQTRLVEEDLTIIKAYDLLEKVAEASGPGSRRLKEHILEGLINVASPREVEMLVRILFGEMRIGVSEGIMIDGVAEAANVTPGIVRRALMLTGNLGGVAKTALKEGAKGLHKIGVKMFLPLKPMMAVMSNDLAEIIKKHGGETAFEYKFDGARIQIHRQADDIRIFSRRLSDVTESVPDIVETVRKEVDSIDVILEGEAFAVGAGGKPLPFQDLMRRFTRVHDVAVMSKRIPLRLCLFDILYLEGRLLIDLTYQERRNLLTKICPKKLTADRIVTGDASKAEAFLNQAIEKGHEGLMAKQLNSRYTPGVRGRGWFKIKPSETLDLVITAADWGSGRRDGWLSNYHLAARDGDDFTDLGKTFKGLTDEEFEWITQRMLELKVKETLHTVYVKPNVVVEVAFNEIQRSPQYNSGYALRFARITRIRQDKDLSQVDSLEKVRQLFEKQFKFKDKANRQFV